MSGEQLAGGRGGRLRLWWWFAAVLVGGLVGLAAGRVLLGGLVLGAAFVLALYLRVSRADDAVGALALRSRALDVWFYVAFAVNVVGATLLVTRHMDALVLALADVTLAIVAGWIVLRPAWVRSRPTS